MNKEKMIAYLKHCEDEMKKASQGLSKLRKLPVVAHDKKILRSMYTKSFKIYSRLRKKIKTELRNFTP